MVKRSEKRLAQPVGQAESASSSIRAERTASIASKTTKRTKRTKAATVTKAKKKTTSTRVTKVSKVTPKKTTKKVARAKKVIQPLGFDTVDLLRELQTKKVSDKEMLKFVTAYDTHGYTRLMHAAMQGDVVTLRALIEVTQKLCTAEQLCHSFLLQHDKVRALTALHYAVSRGHTAAVQLLIDVAGLVAGDNPELLYQTIVPRDGRYEWTPLMFAVNKSFYPMIAQLLTAYAQLLPDSYMQKLLHVRDQWSEAVAAYSTRDDVKKLLHFYTQTYG